MSNLLCKRHQVIAGIILSLLSASIIFIATNDQNSAFAQITAADPVDNNSNGNSGKSAPSSSSTSSDMNDNTITSGPITPSEPSFSDPSGGGTDISSESSQGPLDEKDTTASNGETPKEKQTTIKNELLDQIFSKVKEDLKASGITALGF
jgi:hypothetical protein